MDQIERGTYELAERITGLRRSTLHSMVSRRQIPHTRLSSRLVVFDARELESWMRERHVDPTTDGRR